MKKRVLALVLAFFMVISIVPVSGFKAEAASKDPEYHYYTTMGTSITAGYGMVPSSWGSGSGSTGKGRIFDNGTYPELLANSLNIDDGYDGGREGLRAHEFRVILEDDFHGDDFTEEWSGAICSYDEAALKKLTKEYREAIKKSDLVSIELGMNEIFSLSIQKMKKFIAAQTEGTASSVQIEDFFSQLIGETTGDQITGLLAIADSLGVLSEMSSYVMSALNTSLESYKENLDAILKDVWELNPNVDVVVIGAFNPVRNLLENPIADDTTGAGTAREIILSGGETLGISTDILVDFFEMVVTPMINHQNNYMRYGSQYADKYIYVDVTNIDLTGSQDGTHPSFVGHEYMAERIEIALRANLECQHKYKTTVNVTVPTESENGYTGDIVCADCGTTVEKGKAITYAEYTKMLGDGTVPAYVEQEEVGTGGEDDPYNPDDPIVSDLTYPETEGRSVLAFSSDVHNKSGNVSATRLASWLADSQKNVGATFDFMGLCGDNADGTGAANNTEYWNLVSKVFDALDASTVKDYAVTTGNHEQSNGDYEDVKDSNATAKKITRIGEVKSEENYKVYCFGALEYQNFTSDDVNALSEYMASVGTETPVFILSHFPLHSISARKISNTTAVINVLNNYPNAIFLWGHNHTEADGSEKHYDQIWTDAIDSTPINFTYAAAGCMSDSEYSTGSDSVTAKGLIATVSKGANPEVTLTYLNEQGKLFTETVKVGGKKQTTVTVKALSGSYAFKKVDAPEAGKQYIIVYNGIALDTTYCSGYTNNSSYSYSGFKGKAVTIADDKITGGVYNDMVWKFEGSGSGFMIKSMIRGEYLNATYTSNSSSAKDGVIKVDDTTDVWTLSDGILKSANASKNLAFDVEDDASPKPSTGVYDFFTVRSTGDAVEFYEVPEGMVEEYAPVEKIEVQAVEGDYAFQKADAPEAGKQYVIVYNGIALDTTYCSGYTNNSSYSYSGFKGKAVTIADDKITGGVYNDMVWKFEGSGSGFMIKSMIRGQYLNATYTSNSSSAKDGVIKVDDTTDVWTLSDGILKSANASKNLAFDVEEDASPKPSTGVYDFFTVRSTGDAVEFYEVPEGTVQEYVYVEEEVELNDREKAAKPVDGKSFVIASGNRALATLAKDGYSITSGSGWSSSTTAFSGLNGKRISVSDGKLADGFTKDMVWTFEQTGKNTFRIKNAYTGEYLKGSYSSSSSWYSNSTKGSLKLDESTDDTWSYKNGALTSKNAGEDLMYVNEKDIDDEYTGELNFFTVGSDGDTIVLYYVDDVNSIEEPEFCLNDYVGDCIEPRISGIGDGTFSILINGKALGTKNGELSTLAIMDLDVMYALGDNYRWEIKANEEGTGWTLRNVGTSLYLSVYTGTTATGVNLAPKLSTSEFVWNYDSTNGFSADIQIKGFMGLSETMTNYLTCSGSVLSMSSEALGGHIVMYKQLISPEHQITTSSDGKGNVTYTCSKCGKSYTVKSGLPGCDHVFITKTVYPTCTEKGYKVHTCSICGDSYMDSYVEAIGHQWDDGVVTKEATYDEEGLITYSCTLCEASYTEKLPKLEFVNPFVDVKSGDYYYDSVLWAVKNGVTSGTSDTTFSPAEDCTRGQIVTFLWRSMGKPEPTSTTNPFTDVKESDYFYKAVLWAVEKGITKGTSPTTFSPADICTRGQAVTFMYRSVGEPAIEATNPFKDVADTAYYYNAVLWAVKNNVTKGTGDTTFSPEDHCIRAQIVTFIYRYFG